MSNIMGKSSTEDGSDFLKWFHILNIWRTFMFSFVNPMVYSSGVVRSFKKYILYLWTQSLYNVNRLQVFKICKVFMAVSWYNIFKERCLELYEMGFFSTVLGVFCFGSCLWIFPRLYLVLYNRVCLYSSGSL